VHPDAAHYLAWYAPGERTFLDSRLHLLSHAQSENREIAASLGLFPGEQSVKGPSLLRTRNVSLVLLSDPDRQALGAALRTLVERPDRFPLVEVDGAAVLFAYDSPLPRFDAERLAFTPSRVSGIPEAPNAGLPALPAPAEWWNLASRIGRAAARGNRTRPRYCSCYSNYSAAPNAHLPCRCWPCERHGLASRRHPRADDAWLALARGYLNLGRGSWEATASNNLTLLRYLHHTQVAAALLQTVTLNPDSAAAHELLAGAFGERQLVDLELHHRREQLRLGRRNYIPGEAPEARAERFARLEEAIHQIERTVQDSENRFLVYTHALAGNPLERARIARNLGLANRAI